MHLILTNDTAYWYYKSKKKIEKILISMILTKLDFN